MIFISYAHEDVAYAHALYLELKNAKLDPWMDKPPQPFQWEGLLVGQRWETVLLSKLRLATQIALLLSERSVRKRGYVQKEFLTALDLMSFLPNDQVLVLPIRIDACQVPDLKVGTINLADIQWQDVGQEQIADFVSGLAMQLAGAH